MVLILIIEFRLKNTNNEQQKFQSVLKVLEQYQMYHYQIPRSSQPLTDGIMYTTQLSNTKYDKIRCCNIHINGWTIPIEKYTLILTWNRKTKAMQYLTVFDLNSPDIRIVLFDFKNLIYCKFTLSWTHIKPRHIFTEADHLIVQLDYRFSYSIQSTLRTKNVHSV
jgi:hypothetical protein